MVRGEPVDALSFAELEERARALAAVLQTRLERGDRVLLLCEPGLGFIVDFWACLLAGVVAVPAPAPLAGRVARTRYRLERIVEDCEPALVLGGEFAELPGLPQVTALHTWRPWEPEPGEVRVIQYSSGSTRAPRGVMLTSGNLLHNLEMLAEFQRRPSAMVMVHWLPLYHDMGLIRGMMSPLHLAGDCLMMSPLEFVQKPRRWLEALTRYKATVTGAPNFGFELATQKCLDLAGLDLSSLELAFCTSEPIRAATLRRFQARFGERGLSPETLKPAYGLSEATVMVCGEMGSRFQVRELDEQAFKEGQVRHGNGTEVVACGQLLGGQTARVVDTEARPCGADEIGEVWIQGPSVAAGYWNRPEDPAFSGYTADGAGPYLRTGDLGFFDPEGRLYITGRLKDLLIIRGLNYYPQDLEATVDELEEVRAGATVAFALNQKLLIACEVRPPGDWDELVLKVRAAVGEEFGLSVWGVLFLAPGAGLKTSSGKVQRSLTREAYLRGELELLHSWSRPGVDSSGPL